MALNGDIDGFWLSVVDVDFNYTPQKETYVEHKNDTVIMSRIKLCTVVHDQWSLPRYL